MNGARSNCTSGNANVLGSAHAIRSGIHANWSSRPSVPRAANDPANAPPVRIAARRDTGLVRILGTVMSAIMASMGEDYGLLLPGLPAGRYNQIPLGPCVSQ